MYHKPPQIGFWVKLKTMKTISLLLLLLFCISTHHAYSASIPKFELSAQISSISEITIKDNFGMVIETPVESKVFTPEPAISSLIFLLIFLTFKKRGYHE